MSSCASPATSAAGRSAATRRPTTPRGRATPSGSTTPRRRADLEAAGTFADIAHETLAWTLPLDPAGVRALHGTHSEVNARAHEERERVLNALEEIAQREFGGRVERNMLTAIWTARRV